MFLVWAQGRDPLHTIQTQWSLSDLVLALSALQYIDLVKSEAIQSAIKGLS